MTEAIPNRTIPPLPGGVALTHLQVYPWPSEDGPASGGPHMHLLCTEAYYVLKGSGTVQGLSAGGYREVSLEPGTVVWFTPGLIHRLINLGDLEILVLMQNRGLPEAGDFVLAFPQEYLDAPERYRAAASLASGDHVYAKGEDAARARRDLAVRGFLELKARFEREGPKALEPMYAAAARLVQPKIASWRTIVTEGCRAADPETEARLENLALGRAPHLGEGSIHTLAAAPGERKLGVCGTLGIYPMGE